MKDVTKFTTVKINDTIRSKIIMTRTSNMIAELHKLHWIANRKKKNELHLILKWREQFFNLL